VGLPLILRPSRVYISLLRIAFPTVRISGLPCTAERLPLGGQAFSPGGATILPRSDSIPQLYHKSISPCRRFPSPLRDCTTTRLLLALLSASHYIKSSRAQSSTAVSLRPRQELSGIAKGGAAQDCDPKAYMHTPRISAECEARAAKRALARCRMDAQTARVAQGARLNIARGHRPSRRRRALEACETCRALTGKDRCKQIRCRLRPERD